jgi:hypothetical protein
MSPEPCTRRLSSAARSPPPLPAVAAGDPSRTTARAPRVLASRTRVRPGDLVSAMCPSAVAPRASTALVEHPATARDHDLDYFGLADAGLAGRLVEFFAVVVRGVELLDHPRVRPLVGAADVFHGAAFRRRVVERYPAAHPVGGVGPQFIGGILVVTERLRARRLPEDVVLREPGAVPAAKLRAGSPDARVQDHGRDQPVRLPRVADLPDAILRVPAGLPVPLIGPQPRLELSREEIHVALRHLGRAPGIDDLADGNEAVGMEGGRLLFRDRESCGQRLARWGRRGWGLRGHGCLLGAGAGQTWSR